MIPITLTQADLFAGPDLTQVVELRRRPARPSAGTRTQGGPHTFDPRFRLRHRPSRR